MALETRFHWVKIQGRWLPARRIVHGDPQGGDSWDVLTKRNICWGEEIDEIGPRIVPPAER